MVFLFESIKIKEYNIDFHIIQLKTISLIYIMMLKPFVIDFLKNLMQKSNFISQEINPSKKYLEMQYLCKKQLNHLFIYLLAF